MAIGTGANSIAEMPDSVSTLTGKKVNNYFDGLTVCKKHKMIFMIIMVAYFFEQITNWNFGFIAPSLIKSWGLTMADIGRISFVYFMAMTFGGLLGGVISDSIGRRKTFLGSIFLFSVASILNGFANNVLTFTIFRALTGFGVFCLMVTSQAYFSEMAPAECRGKWQSLSAAVGFTAAPIIGGLCSLIIPLSPQAWRYILVLGGLGLVPFVVGLKYLQESPRWLVAEGKVDLAEKVVWEVSGVPVSLKNVPLPSGKKENLLGRITGMFSWKYLKRTLVILAFVLLTTPATFVVTNWTTTLLNQRGLDVAESLRVSFILMIGVPVGLYISSFIADKGGRKIPMVILCALASVLAVMFGKVSGFWPISLIGFLLIAAIMAFAFISYSYIAESYPTSLRNTAVGIHNSVGRFATAAFQLVIPVIFAQYKFVGIYSIVAIMILVPAGILAIWGARTGGKSLEEIS
ncbi:sugar phosphate permease [Desulfosporosinus acidiphilus SJ4]|uniref:Sugar phosphate permease n=1 Tax=Desulfosporosinus acidiphilus (strain DSM 22704 / JCM 16185 / SJ4) TaxID=646529 RepID=I4D913_DESAJ|nr:MFS transporter [Desulfosporosinus acidiphilus]AFM42287.1 sugar phosphate permease [Desulfosporosinus acidiphilus SJ4]